MFEISGSDIENLNDGDLRTLVARLASSELREQGCPVSSVTAGGNQDAADGGLDVRVECTVGVAKPDFVPRSVTGFQVKKPDMPAGAIREEMRPGGILRPVIGELAAASGAYIIVSAQGSVADKPLADRRKAIRNQLGALDAAENLHTDFYDRDRLANWVNEYPGTAAWVRNRTGRGLTGWSSIGNWVGTTVAELGEYLFDDKACLIDERTAERDPLAIGEGIVRLREALRVPGRCVRLIGLSGLGKTRLVQALFESAIGDEPLDPGLAVYTDYSVETNPSARDMARQLAMRGERAVLIIDNCNPATHGELARICSYTGSKVSLLTVEYDVQDDEPERTEVFRLQSTSPELVSHWLAQIFPDISEVDRRRIAEFSDGNFRVGRALAETLGKGESFGKLKNRDLFKRIFQQRNEPDQNLLLAAGDLSLLFSVDGEDTSDDSELALIGGLRGIGAAAEYAALFELRGRGIVQLRGRWRAILPHAIANPLASIALERIPPANFDRFCTSLTPRMRKSLSRRLGFLHDSAEARAAVIRLLRSDGAFGDLFALGADGLQVISNIAPVAPEAVLKKIRDELDGPNGKMTVATDALGRMQWIRLIKLLAYDPQMFEDAAMLLSRFVAAEPEGHRNNSARGAFAELFHLYLSGTKARPEQRRAVVRLLAQSVDATRARCALVALKALLTTHHFSSSSDLDFGARSRDWGWRPRINGDISDWYNAAIDLAVEMSPVFDDARDLLADRIRGLWRYGACHEAIESAAASFTKDRPWIAGWHGFRAAHRYLGKAMPAEAKAKLKEIIRRLEPSDLLHQARAVILSGANGGCDLVDGEPEDEDVVRSWEKASRMAQDVGRLLAQDAETRKQFLSELLAAPRVQRAYECGRGLAEGTEDLPAMWRELGAQFASADQNTRDATALGGFIYEAHKHDLAFTSTALEAAIDDPHLCRFLPYLQGRVGINKDGIGRLQRAIGSDVVRATDFFSIANGIVTDAPPKELAALLVDIAGMERGVAVALDILHMHFYGNREGRVPEDRLLIQIGRDLLGRIDFSESGTLHNAGIDTVIRICCSGSDGEGATRDICTHIRTSLHSGHFLTDDRGSVVKALFETQPLVALDVFVLGEAATRSLGLFQEYRADGNPLQDMDPSILRQWADLDPAIRYRLLGEAIAMFACEHGDEGNNLAPLLLQMIEHAPEKFEFLGDYWTRLHPRSWIGSLADVLAKRRESLLQFRESSHAEVRRWVDQMIPAIDRWIESVRERERGEEASFE